MKLKFTRVAVITTFFSLFLFFFISETNAQLILYSGVATKGYNTSNSTGVAINTNTGTINYASASNEDGIIGNFVLDIIKRDRLFGISMIGSSGYGAVVLYNITANKIVEKASFSGANGKYPTGRLLPFNGKYYGTTIYGGANDEGVIFTVNSKGSYLKKRMDFKSGVTGKYPISGLIEANGKLYGLTSGDYGDAEDGLVPADHGGLYVYDPVVNAITMLYDFGTSTSDITHGYCPVANLVLANDGNLYGMTPYGGAFGGGTIFCYNLSTNTFAKKKDLSSSSGTRPSGALIQSYGNLNILYGQTSLGGTDNRGTIFQYNTQINSITPLISFPASSYGTGAIFSFGTLFEDFYNHGTLYGVGLESDFTLPHGSNVFSYVVGGSLNKIAVLDSSFIHYNQFVDNCYACRRAAFEKINHSTTNAAITLNIMENPVHSILKINVQSTMPKNATIIVANMIGQTFLKKQVSLSKGNNPFEFGISLGSKGNYVLQIVSDAGITSKMFSAY